MRVVIMTLIFLVMAVPSFGMNLFIGNMQGGSEEIIPVRKLDEGEAFSFIVAKNDPNVLGDVTILNMPDGSQFQNGIFSWRPGSEQSGLYTVSFSAIDSNLETTYIVIRIIVADTIFTIRYDRTFERLFTAFDADDDPIEITVAGLPLGATFTGSQFTPKLFTWTPTKQQVGNYQMIVTATDFPLNGEPKQDISLIQIKVSKLTKGERRADFNIDDQIDNGDMGYFAKTWMAGVPLPVLPAPTIIDVPGELNNEDASEMLRRLMEEFPGKIGPTNIYISLEELSKIVLYTWFNEQRE